MSCNHRILGTSLKHSTSFSRWAATSKLSSNWTSGITVAVVSRHGEEPRLLLELRSPSWREQDAQLIEPQHITHFPYQKWCYSCVKYFIIIIIMIQSNLRRVVSFLLGSLAFFYGLWQFRKTLSDRIAEWEKRDESKLILWVRGLLFSLIRFFLLKYPVFCGAKLTH